MNGELWQLPEVWVQISRVRSISTGFSGCISAQKLGKSYLGYSMGNTDLERIQRLTDALQKVQAMKGSPDIINSLLKAIEEERAGRS